MEKEAEAGEQGQLIETAPENAVDLDKKARQYHATVRKRLAIQEKEKTQKAELRILAEEAGLQPLENGDIEYNHEDVHILLKPPIEGKLTVTVDE